MANITVTTTDAWIPEIWSKNTLSAVEFATSAAGRVNREYEGEIKSQGDTVKIPHVNNYTANDKSASTDVTFEAITHGTTSLTINKYKYAAFKVERIAEKQALPGFVEKQTKKLGYAIARQRDVDILALFTGFSQTVGTLGVEMVDADYFSAWQKLAEAGALVEDSMNSDCSIYLSPAAYVAALKTDRFVNRDYAGEESASALRRANVGTILGVPVYMSNLLNAPSAGQHACAMFHKDALALAMQMDVTVDKDFIIEGLADAVVASVIYGVGELARPVETAGSASTTDAFGVYLKTV
jgi:hypothetical protein